MKTLFKNAYVLIRGEKEYETLSNSFVLVENDTIKYVGQNDPKTSCDRVIDCTGKLLMPGLINTHGHIPMSLLRGVGSGQTLQDWLFKYIFPIEDQFTDKETYAGSLLSCMEMIRSGTTTFSDMYFLPMGTLQAVAESGLRGNITYCGNCDKSINEVTKSQRWNEVIAYMNLLHNKGDEKANIKFFPSVDKLSNEIKDAIKEQRIVGELSIHSVYLTSKQYVIETAKLNKQYGTPIQAHASENNGEVEGCIKANGCTPIQYLDQCGFFDGNKVYLAHCVKATDDDLKIMKSKDVTLVHNPSSNLKLGSGIAPIKKAVSMGINVTLGTDGCASNNNLDMFEEMHLAALLATGSTEDPTAISVTNVIDMVTINGAKALDRKDIGEIKEGYKADLLVIDLDKPHLYPRIDIPSLIVYSMSSKDISLTMCNGKILYENGQYFTLNKDKIFSLVDECMKNLKVKVL